MGNLIQNNSTMTLSQRLKAAQNKPVVLVDVSDSMDKIVEGNTRSIDALREVVKGIHGPIKLLSFSCSYSEVTKDTIPEPEGGTWLSPVLEKIKTDGHTEAIIITDGDVNVCNQDLTLEAAKGLKLKILFIGPGEKPAFLVKLAEQSGGFCDKKDVKLTAELTGDIQALLPPVEGQGPISL